MKIVQQEIQNSQTSQARKSSKAKSTGSKKVSSDKKSAGGAKADQVQISSAGQQMKTLGAQIKEASEVKVAALKSEVESGNYHRPATDIADAIIQTVQNLA